MAVKRHCILCNTLIASGFTCSDCLHEFTRVRTLDDQPLDEWISSVQQVLRFRLSGFERPLDMF
ncbi:MAG: nucleotide-binding protein [Candidatus Thermoplasmatota archaeon]|nr:nucleotide-binding protein [Candidatus Thermoplasmatota archaeon]